MHSLRINQERYSSSSPNHVPVLYIYSPQATDGVWWRVLCITLSLPPFPIPVAHVSQKNNYQYASVLKLISPILFPWPLLRCICSLNFDRSLYYETKSLLQSLPLEFANDPQDTIVLTKLTCNEACCSPGSSINPTQYRSHTDEKQSSISHISVL